MKMDKTSKNIEKASKKRAGHNKRNKMILVVLFKLDESFIEAHNTTKNTNENMVSAMVSNVTLVLDVHDVFYLYVHSSNSLKKHDKKGARIISVVLDERNHRKGYSFGLFRFGH